MRFWKLVAVAVAVAAVVLFCYTVYFRIYYITLLLTVRCALLAVTVIPRRSHNGTEFSNIRPASLEFSKNTRGWNV